VVRFYADPSGWIRFNQWLRNLLNFACLHCTVCAAAKRRSASRKYGAEKT
jgi:hypothetical protein